MDYSGDCGVRKEGKAMVNAVSSTQSDARDCPLFTIIVLCYKNTSLLYGMLTTIFSQDYPRIQLIVSDDASETFDPDAIRDYIVFKKKDNIESFIVRKNEENQGTVRHFHDVLELAKGEYIIFTAADDRFTDENVLSTYSEIYRTNPEKQWIVAQMQMVTANYRQELFVMPAEKDEKYFASNDSKTLFSRWSRSTMAVPCCMSFRREAIKQVGGVDLDYMYLEDWPLVLRLLRNGYAPYYLQMIVAMHSTGGISNANRTYGGEVKKAYHKDKELFFRKEVDPYIDLLTEEDKKYLNLYKHEIAERLRFFDVEWFEASFLQKIHLLIQKPLRIKWLFERKFMSKRRGGRKVRLALAIIMFALGADLVRRYGVPEMEKFMGAFGTMACIGSIVLACFCVGTFVIERYFKREQNKRDHLVH